MCRAILSLFMWFRFSYILSLQNLIMCGRKCPTTTTTTTYTQWVSHHVGKKKPGSPLFFRFELSFYTSPTKSLLCAFFFYTSPTASLFTQPRQQQQQQQQPQQKKTRKVTRVIFCVCFRGFSIYCARYRRVLYVCGRHISIHIRVMDG